MLHHLHHDHESANAIVLVCNHLSFFKHGITQVEQCKLAQTGCEFDFVNFYMICYCWLQGNWKISIIIGLITIFIIFRFISAVVEEYLAPSISYISEWLKLPEALAAVTLLALANGAGDVISALVAGGTSDGLSYNIGSIYGAGFVKPFLLPSTLLIKFVCSIVVAMTIFNATEDIQLEPSAIWRDVGIYIIATISIIIFGIIGELSTLSAMVMLGEYFMLVFIVWWMERSKSGSEGIQNSESEQEKEDKKAKIQMEQSKKIHDKDLIVFVDDKTPEEKQAVSKRWKVPLSKINTAKPIDRMRLLSAKLHAVIFLALKTQLKHQESEVQFSEMSGLDKFLFILDRPFHYARKITLPPCEPENWEKMWATIFPVPGLLFIAFSITLAPKVWWLYTIPFGVALSAYIHFYSEEKEPPSFFIGLEVWGTIGALMWTYIISGTLIDLLNFMGMVSKLDTTYIGLTVIAIGNALPDAVTTIALAKQGYALMGLTGAYAGQLFGLLVGFGISLLKKTMVEGPQKFNIFELDDLEKNGMNIAVIMISLFNLVLTFIYGVCNSYKYTKTLARIIGSLYIAFIAISTIYAIYKAVH